VVKIIDLPLQKQGVKSEKVQVSEQGKEAQSEYRVLQNMGGEFAFVELEPHTGRTHQLRVHMAAIACPIMGDGKYGGTDAFDERFSKKLHLHAFSLVCKDLGIKAEAKLPEHMEKLL
jgi:23S rRNA pseudouridine955/2504/2580 synthase